MYFHIEGPAENSWLGFGIGAQMDSSKMWVVYKNSAGTGKSLLFLQVITERETTLEVIEGFRGLVLT